MTATTETIADTGVEPTAPAPSQAPVDAAAKLWRLACAVAVGGWLASVVAGMLWFGVPEALSGLAGDAWASGAVIALAFLSGLLVVLAPAVSLMLASALGVVSFMVWAQLFPSAAEPRQWIPPSVAELAEWQCGRGGSYRWEGLHSWQSCTVDMQAKRIDVTIEPGASRLWLSGRAKDTPCTALVGHYYDLPTSWRIEIRSHGDELIAVCRQWNRW